MWNSDLDWCFQIKERILYPVNWGFDYLKSWNLLQQGDHGWWKIRVLLMLLQDSVPYCSRKFHGYIWKNFSSKDWREFLEALRQKGQKVQAWWCSLWAGVFSLALRWWIKAFGLPLEREEKLEWKCNIIASLVWIIKIAVKAPYKPKCRLTT